MGRIRLRRYGRNAVLADKGTMDVRQIQSALQQEELVAKQVLNEGYDHVIYGIKIYGRNGKLAAMDFYMWPMNDEEFYRQTRKWRNVLVYALHGGRERCTDTKDTLKETITA